jgi:hypothetical protein
MLTPVQCLCACVSCAHARAQHPRTRAQTPTHTRIHPQHKKTPVRAHLDAHKHGDDVTGHEPFGSEKCQPPGVRNNRHGGRLQHARLSRMSVARVSSRGEEPTSGGLLDACALDPPVVLAEGAALGQTKVRQLIAEPACGGTVRTCCRTAEHSRRRACTGAPASACARASALRSYRSLPHCPARAPAALSSASCHIGSVSREQGFEQCGSSSAAAAVARARASERGRGGERGGGD